MASAALADQSASLCLLPFSRNEMPPLFYVHEISGSVLHFASVAGRLAARRSVLGLQCIGLNPGFDPDRTVEAMAERYLGIVRRENRPPPYDIIGYSMGGLVAFEMAVRLLDEGVPVRLGLLDPPVPCSLTTSDPARVVRLIARTLAIPSVVDAGTDDPEELLELLVTEARSTGQLPASYTAADLQPTVELQLINSDAAANYRPPRSLPGDIHMLCADANLMDEQVTGWRPYIDGRILSEAVDADHFTLFRGPNAFTVADVLERWLTEPEPPARG
jgi:thioesterase domain-containing protein